jgi:NADH dehydrogenase
MQIDGHENLWAAGDCAAIPWEDNGEMKIAPPTAQLALRQGSQIGANIARVLKGEATKPFTYRYMGQLATVGAREAVAEVMGFRFSGFFAWWMWRSIYLAKLPGFARKLRVLVDWSFELVFPRDLSVPLPISEDPMPPVHFEAGEIFVDQGEACRAFLYVRTGSITASGPGLPDVIYPAGSVIDQDETENGQWKRTLTATERTDAVLFRGRTLELLKTSLRMVPR